MALNMSPITLGLLALLAYRTYHGKGRLAAQRAISPAARLAARAFRRPRQAAASATFCAEAWAA
jgi:hypothetical protein